MTFSQPGNWTSWPPHEHAAMLEEAYLYIDMPAPAWGIQMVYTNPQAPEIAVVVREGDCVLMPPRLSPERGRARRVNQFPVDDGGQSGGRGSPVRGGQCATGICRQRGLAWMPDGAGR